MLFYEPGHHKQHGLRHDPFKAFVAPRPIGWISTVDADGRGNLAPYSYFNAVCDRPPVVIFSSGPAADGSKKDSVLNAETTGEFVCSIVPHALREQMNQTAIHLPHGQDEMPHAGLEGLPSTLVRPLRVKGAPAHFECRYLHTVTLPPGPSGHSQLVVFGQGVGVHVDEAVIKDGLVDVLSYGPVARLGYFDYTTVESIYAMARPD